MTLKEVLTAQGITEEQANAILKSMKENKIYTASEENLDIRYSKLKGEYDSLESKYGESTKLIDDLKSGAKDTKGLQDKIAAYETKITELESKLSAEQLTNAINLALRDAKATDPDYLAYKLAEKYKDELLLDEQGKVKGMDDKIAGLKVQFPSHFEKAESGVKIEEIKLPGNGAPQGMTKSEFFKKSYTERAEFAKNNPEAYQTLMSE